jgi:alpha,alpha-trehalase
MSRALDDSKSLADALPKAAPAQILAAYYRSKPNSAASMRSFLAAHFDLETNAAPVTEPTAGLGLEAHIQELWTLLKRETRSVPAGSSLLPLPNPYVIPGGRFTEMYYWDSYFTMLGFGPREASLRRHMVGNFAHLVSTYGRIPNGNRSYYLSRSQPPFFFKMVELLSPEDPGSAFAEYLPELKTEHAFWMMGDSTARPGAPQGRVVMLGNGAILNRYWDDRDTPRDESYREDKQLAQTANREPGELYTDIRAAAESGWDFSSRWLADKRTLATIQTSSIVPVDLNSILYGLERAIALGCRSMQDRKCADDFENKADARRAAVRDYLWNEGARTFDDYNWRNQEPVGNVSAAMLYPLFFGIADDVQAKAVAATVRAELLEDGGLVTSTQNTGEQWDFPNGWAPLQWIAVVGLCRYGEQEIAEEVARNWVTTVSRVYEATGKLLEKYNVVTVTPGGGGEYPLQDGFGWTNGVTLALSRLFPRGLDFSPAESDTARDVHRDVEERVGESNFNCPVRPKHSN